MLKNVKFILCLTIFIIKIFKLHKLNFLYYVIQYYKNNIYIYIYVIHILILFYNDILKHTYHILFYLASFNIFG